MQAFVSRDIRQIATQAWQLGSLFRGNKHNIGGWLICGGWIADVVLTGYLYL
jgi:hypothetical protein